MTESEPDEPEAVSDGHQADQDVPVLCLTPKAIREVSVALARLAVAIVISRGATDR